MTTLSPVPPGTYTPIKYQCKIRPNDWKLLSFVVQTKSLNLSIASYRLGVPMSTLKDSVNHLKDLGVLQ